MSAWTIGELILISIANSVKCKYTPVLNLFEYAQKIIEAVMLVLRSTSYIKFMQNSL